MGLNSLKLGSEIHQFGLQIHQVGAQIHETGGPNPLKIGLGGLLEGSWGHLGPKRAPRANKSSKSAFVGLSWTPSWGPCWAMLGLCWQLFVASWWSEGHLTQQEAEDGQSNPKMPQHSPQEHDFRAMLAGLGVPKHYKNFLFLKLFIN